MAVLITFNKFLSINRCTKIEDVVTFSFCWSSARQRAARSRTTRVDCTRSTDRWQRSTWTRRVSSGRRTSLSQRYGVRVTSCSLLACSSSRFHVNVRLVITLLYGWYCYFFHRFISLAFSLLFSPFLYGWYCYFPSFSVALLFSPMFFFPCFLLQYCANVFKVFLNLYVCINVYKGLNSVTHTCMCIPVSICPILHDCDLNN